MHAIFRNLCKPGNSRTWASGSCQILIYSAILLFLDSARFLLRFMSKTLGYQSILLVDRYKLDIFPIYKIFSFRMYLCFLLKATEKSAYHCRFFWPDIKCPPETAGIFMFAGKMIFSLPCFCGGFSVPAGHCHRHDFLYYRAFPAQFPYLFSDRQFSSTSAPCRVHQSPEA